MDVSDMTSLIDDHGMSDLTTARKVQAINDAYHDICSREAWPFLEALSASVSITANTASVTLPTGNSKIKKWVIPSIYHTLTPERAENIMSRYGEITSTGVPIYYYFTGDSSTAKLYPVPAASYTSTLYYVKYPTDLASSDVASAVLLPARHHTAIVSGALAKLYVMGDDIELGSYFSQVFENRIQTMKDDLMHRQYDRTDYIVDITSPYLEQGF